MSSTVQSDVQSDSRKSVLKRVRFLSPLSVSCGCISAILALKWQQYLQFVVEFELDAGVKLFVMVEALLAFPLARNKGTKDLEHASESDQIFPRNR